MNRLCAALAVVLIGAVPSPSPSPAVSPSAAAKIGPWSMVTDRLNADLQTGAFSAPDRVEMTRADGSTVTADRAEGNYKQRVVNLYGDVVMHDQSGTLGMQSAHTNEQGPADLTADQLHFDDLKRIYDAAGNVHYTQGDRRMVADHAHLDDLTHELTLDGHVHVLDGTRTLDASHAVYNTVSGLGKAVGDVTMEFPGAKISIATPKPINIKGPKIIP